MRRSILTVGLLLAFFGLALTTPTSRTTVAAQKGKDHKITICHHTSSETNPIVVITIDRHALPHHVANHGDGEFDTEECPREGQ